MFNWDVSVGALDIFGFLRIFKQCSSSSLLLTEKKKKNKWIKYTIFDRIKNKYNSFVYKKKNHNVIY